MISIIYKPLNKKGAPSRFNIAFNKYPRPEFNMLLKGDKIEITETAFDGVYIVEDIWRDSSGRVGAAKINLRREVKGNDIEGYAHIIREDDIQTYNSVSDKKPKEPISIVKGTFFPTEKEYERGFAHRYFIARYDDELATEVTKDFYNDKWEDLAEGVYRRTYVKWYLMEGIDYRRDKSNLVEGGITVASLNEANVIKASEDLPQLKNTIEDFTLYKGPIKLSEEDLSKKS